MSDHEALEMMIQGINERLNRLDADLRDLERRVAQVEYEARDAHGECSGLRSDISELRHRVDYG